MDICAECCNAVLCVAVNTRGELKVGCETMLRQKKDGKWCGLIVHGVMRKLIAWACRSAG
jgi:hypothetical protein